MVGVGNCSSELLVLSLMSLLRIELLRAGGRLDASSRFASMPGIKGRIMNSIDLTALDTVVENVPFMCVKVKCEVNPDQCSLEFEGTTLRKLIRVSLVQVKLPSVVFGLLVSSYYALGSFPPTS